MGVPKAFVSFTSRYSARFSQGPSEKKIPSCVWQKDGQRNRVEILHSTQFSTSWEKLLDQGLNLGILSEPNQPG